MLIIFVAVARHRREIKQLLDSARDRLRTGAADAEASSIAPAETSPPKTKGRSSRQPSKSDETHVQPSPRDGRSAPSTNSFGKKHGSLIRHVVKLLVLSTLLAAGLTLFVRHLPDIFPRRKGEFDQQSMILSGTILLDLRCNVDNAVSRVQRSSSFVWHK
jgi:hypothetical protein